jgi:spermidine/putrescine transport system ATP-binding protein
MGNLDVLNVNDVNQIEIKNLVKKFNNYIAVNNINIEIKKGEFFSLLGPSGCGKTTTLRIIAGLEEATSGKVFLNGKDVTNVPAYKCNVNTVFQDYAIFPHMNVFENIYFPLRMRKISRKIAEEKILKVLKLVEMVDYKERYSNQLSGGQKQRIALARALVNEPEALLLDEPLGALDFKLREVMQTALKNIQEALGITFVYVTHDQTEAITMSNRIAVMKDGIIHQIGTPNEIYNNPITPFVASFIGEMNFLKGKVEGYRENNILINISNTILVCRNNKMVSIGDNVLVCIRPESLQINPKDKMSNMICARVDRIVFKGDCFEVFSKFNEYNLQISVHCKNLDFTQEFKGDISIGWSSQNAIVLPQEKIY